MELEQHIVNLDLPAEQRWAFLANYRDEMNALIGCYLTDFDEFPIILGSIHVYKNQFISPDYLDEISFISSLSDFSEEQVLMANLYYDILKFYFGCTAFATSTHDSILHARNLDWHTENNLLSEHTTVFDFQRNGSTIFKTVGWYGFIGCLSGMKPGKFSITLNAALSTDKPQVATPISFLLRDVLATSMSFQEAQSKLENTVIASDCLLLLSGTTPNEKVVIERTPTRYATIETDEDFIIVTNDFKKIQNNLEETDNVLRTTSCGRYLRAEELLKEHRPSNSTDCLAILKDSNVMMGITVQQMVFDTQSGEVYVVKT